MVDQPITSQPDQAVGQPPPGGGLREWLIAGAIACDRAGRITAYAPEAEHFTGTKPANALGRPISVLSLELEKLFQKILTDPHPAAEHDIVMVDPTGMPTNVRVQTTRLMDITGSPVGVLLVLSDLRATSRLEDKIRRLDRLANVGTLSASLAHEIKNALVAVKTFMDLLLEKNHDADLAAVVGREMKRIDDLVSQMLRVSHPARRQFSPVSVHELLDHALRLLQHQIKEKLITLRRPLTAAPDVILGDANELEQAFMNLLLNAIEAMGPNGELTVRTHTLPADGGRAPQIEITVQDTGIGIPPENMGRLFDTFFTTKKNGTGLGLAITRRVVQEHRGEITVTSQPQQGAEFRLRLPLI